MRQVIDRGTSEIDDPDRLAPADRPVAAVEVGGTAYLLPARERDPVDHVRHRDG
jgi:hypothetical protein